MTNQQRWAQKAFEEVNKIGNDKWEKFKSAALNGPGLIQQSGACQALHFWDSKKEDVDYLKALSAVYYYKKSNFSKEDLLKEVRTDDFHTYLQISNDLIECATWIRRFVQAKEAMKKEDKD